jgi:hypothetical protein
LTAWLESVIQKSAEEMELAGKTIFRFSQSIRDGLTKLPVQAWEADGWARGLKIGLIRLEGYFFRVGSGKRSPVSFFVRNEEDRYVGLRRESITQAATYVSLVTDYGYARARTRFESRWMDVAVYGPDGQAWIYAENKANQKTLEKLCARLSMEFQNDVPPIDPKAKRIDDALMKAHHIRRNRPRFFWAVCPSSHAVFEIQYLRSGGFCLKSLSQLPNALESLVP